MLDRRRSGRSFNPLRDCDCPRPAPPLGNDAKFCRAHRSRVDRSGRSVREFPPHRDRRNDEGRQQHPAVLVEPQDYLFLRSGWATADFDAILFPGGFDAHRAQHPHQWRRWRKDGDGYKVCSESCATAKDWKRLRYTKQTLEPLPPKGFRFAGSFKSVGGGTFGDTTALRYGFWTFSADGRFSTSSAASVTVNTCCGDHRRQSCPIVGRSRPVKEYAC
jgi:hypothetical protein